MVWILQGQCLIVKVENSTYQHFLSPNDHSKDCQQKEHGVFPKIC
jgi:hypothetical protein